MDDHDAIPVENATAGAFGDYAKMEADLAASRERERILRSYVEQAVDRMEHLEGRIVQLGGEL